MKKEKIRHAGLVLLVLLAIVGGIYLFLYNASYNPDFSMIDVLSGATKKTHRAAGDPTKEKTASAWGYTKDDVAWSGKSDEEGIVTAGTTYRVLKNISDREKTDEQVLLSNRENPDYQKAVRRIAENLEKQGYRIRIKECGETMMLSLVHAGHFDWFLMCEEVSP